MPTSAAGLNERHEASHNQIHDIGAVGIFNYGSRGARIHDNTIERTTTWNSPPELNGDEGPWGMSLGGGCSDDDEFSNNHVFDSGGIGIYIPGLQNLWVQGVGCGSAIVHFSNRSAPTNVDARC